MREILTNLFLDLLEVNIVAAVVILSLSFWAENSEKDTVPDG